MFQPPHSSRTPRPRPHPRPLRRTRWRNYRPQRTILMCRRHDSPDAPQETLAAEESAALADTPPVPDHIAAVLAPLTKALTPLAEDVGHPRELPDMPEFQAVVAAFHRPDATLALLSEYATGSNWPLACAALTVLAEHPDRQDLRDPIMRRLGNSRPFVLPYTFDFLTSLEFRPLVGAALLAAQDWWANNPVIPGFFDEYFARSAALGDQPDFGGGLTGTPDLETGPADALARKLTHPFAEQLLAGLREWGQTRIDRTFLGTVGTFQNAADEDPLLVSPPAWREALATAETVIRQNRPRSVLVTGSPRVGKTAFLALLGARLRDAGWTVFAAGGNELMADQMYIGQLEGRIRKIVDALHARRKLVWFARDLAQIANSGTHQGQSASILDQILPAIAAGDLIVVGETSEAAATRLFQARPSLRSVMEVVPLRAMDDGDAMDLAIQVGERITEHAGVLVSRQAVVTTMDLARHYLGGGQLPGAVLELLKRAAAHSLNADEATLTPDSVIATLSGISGLPKVILDTSQRVELAQVRDFFTRRVIGQTEAVNAVVDRIAMLKAGLTDPGRPTGVFLFAGPTGTGKTELAKTLAEFLFGSADRLTRLDMSEFQTPESTSKILGQRGEPGGDSLIDRIRKQPFSVVLLDEFEKAHPNCWDLFLQIFDDGRLSDANGGEADFRHCMIILTSNLGATEHRGGGLGFLPEAGAYTEDQVLRTIARTFRPEFVNRLDKIIVFRPLSRELMRGILHRELALIQERRGLRERAWAIEWEASAIDFLLDRGFSPEMGARPLKRAIDQLLLAPLAATLVEHRFPEGDQFLFVRSNGQAIEVEFVDPDAEPADRAAPEADMDGELSLPAIVLRQTGSAEERASLAAHWREIGSELAGDSWAAANERLRVAMDDPAIWSRDDRHRVFSALEMTDRVKEAARTAERLFQRYETSSRQPARASRELGARLALQLFNLRNGLDDIATNAPIDALLRVEPAMDAGGDSGSAPDWCEKLSGMYRQWAAKRHMQIRIVKPRHAAGAPILHVTGFGAFHTLKAEAGLHVLDGPAHENQRRTVARVMVAAGAEQTPPEAGEYDAASLLLAAGSAGAAPSGSAPSASTPSATNPSGTTPSGTTIVRRYREGPAPMARDVAGGWRTGRLDAVLGGDFDLMGAVSRRQPAD